MRVERLIAAFSGPAALPCSALLLGIYYLRHWAMRAARPGRRGLSLARRTYADL
jgi:hypothetical protein